MAGVAGVVSVRCVVVGVDVLVGGTVDGVTIGGASAGAGLASLLTSIPTVADKIVGIIQQSGDGFGPTTGFDQYPDQNLDIIAGYNKCDMTSEQTKLGKVFYYKML